jgi:DNA-binding FrmR family transcriptional regulator
MPHSPSDKQRALTRLRRIRGQAEALERAIEAGAECSTLLQQISAVRGAAGGLMAEVLESHLRDTLRQTVGTAIPMSASDDMDEIAKILRAYLK